MSTNSLFLGNSGYSKDFSQVIERTISIAKLPMLQLEQQRAQTGDRSAAITDIQSKFESLRLALADLSTSVGSTTLTAAFSSPGIASAQLGEHAAPGNFTLTVEDLGSYTSYVTQSEVTDPKSEGLGNELTKTLIVDGVETKLTLSENTLGALQEAINASATGVRAAIINVSATSTPSYKLTIQGNKLGAQSIMLKDGDASGADLAGTTLNTGSNVRYSVNGVPVNGESRTVTLAPGISLTFNTTTAESGPIDVVVKRTASQLSDRLRSVVAAYNAAAGKLDEHRGKTPGVLQGQSVIATLSKILRDLTGYASQTGAFQSFTDIGLSFDDKGVLSFNASALAGLSDEKLDQLLAFLGTEKTSGFVNTALTAIGVATTPESGILALEKTSYTERSKTEALQVQQMQERLDLMETNLRERFAALDSAIAALQQQALYFNNMFESMRMAQQMYSK